MSLITACPACHTQFEVTESELHAYRGKVRCGECEHVFDAAAHLLGSEPPAANTIAEQPTAATPAESPSTISALTSTAWPETTTLAEHDSIENTQDLANVDATDAATAEHDSADHHYIDVADANVLHTMSEDVTAATADITPDETLPSHDAWQAQTESVHSDETASTELTEPSVPEFLRNVSLTDERPPQTAPSPARQSIQMGLLILLTLGLCMQWLYFSRTHLAANFPQSKPVLQSLCRALHCTVALPQDITQLTIDDADIQEHREREGVLVFSSVLMNHARLTQAYPWIELTLTNTSDEPVIRRILKPEDYLPASLTVADGLAAQQEIRVNTLLGVTDQGVAGFRVAIAYP